MSDAITIIFDMIAEDEGVDWLSIMFNAIIVLIMIFTWFNAWHMRKLAARSNKTADHMAAIQETNIKVLVLPNIKEILFGLNSIRKIAYFKMDEQMKNHGKVWDKIGQAIFYFDEDDEVYKSIISLDNEMWDLTEAIGNRESFLAIEKKENKPAEYAQLTDIIVNKSKVIFSIASSINKEIVKRYRVGLPRVRHTKASQV